MRFLRPDLGIWLLAAPVVFACWYARWAYAERCRRRFGVAARFKVLSRRASIRRELITLTLALLVIGGGVLALMHPQLLLTWKSPEFERQDVVLVLDRSVSMRARDISPSRFSRAIDELRHFLRKKPDGIDRVGLVGFAGTSLILSYLTRDVDSLLFYMDWIEEDQTPHFGTDIGAALNAAIQVADKDTRETRKFFLVISDGEDQGRELTQALARLQNESRRVHAIGIGSDEEALMPVIGDDGREAFLTDEDGRPMTTRFSERTLRLIAGTTGGRYFRSVTGAELSQAMSDIAAAERRQVGWATSTAWRDFYRETLAVAGVAAALLMLLL